MLLISLGLLGFGQLADATTTPAIEIQKQSNAFNQGAGFMSSDIGTIVSLVIKTILSLLAIIFVVLMITAGFKWMTAAGNEQQIEKARDTIKAAAIGLVIVLAAYSITYFIFDRLPFDMASPTNITTSGPT